MARDQSAPPSRQQLADDILFHKVGAFIATTRSVEEFLALGKRVRLLDSPASWTRTVESITKHLSPDDKAVARKLIGEIIDRQFHISPSPSSEEIEPESEGKESPASTDGPDEPHPAHGEDDAHPTISMEAAVAVGELAREFYISLHSPPRLPMFHRSLLTTQISALELLVGALYEAFLTVHPESLSATKYLPLAELNQFSSIEDAIEAVIEGEVDSFRRQSLDEWDKWFQDRLNIHFSDLAPDLPRLTEALERRNIVVHNDALVSRQYRLRVGLKNAPPLGTRLDVDDTYLRTVIDDTTVFGNLLAYATWRKLGAIHDIDALTDDMNSQLMDSGRWEATLAYCDRAIAQKLYGSNSNHLILMVNRWLAKKRLSGIAAIETEVTEWDVSGLDEVFAVAREALLDHMDHIGDSLRRMVAAHKLPLAFVHRWPILEEFRKTPAYAAIVGENEPWVAPLVLDVLEPAPKPRRQRARRPKLN